MTDRGRLGSLRLGCASTRAELSRILEFPLPKPFDSSDLQMSRQILVLDRKQELSQCLAGREEMGDFQDTSLTPN